jgi:hypothetical protein
MINKAVFSYICKEEKSPSGYNTFKDMCLSLALSVNVAKRHFEKIELITNSYAADLFIDKLKLPFTSVLTEFDNYKELDSRWWGWGKVKAYSMQKEPFIHIDGDFFLWDKPSKDKLNAPLLFQSLETPFTGGYSWYEKLLEIPVPNFPKIIKDNPVDYAFNCGVCGANDLSIVSKWLEYSSDFVLNKENFFLGIIEVGIP